MIATIISVVLILPLIIWLVICILKEDLDECVAASLIFLALVGGFILAVSLVIGYDKGNLTKKASIEEALSLGSKLAMHDAIEYNEDIREGDNYFCRFTLRPDSDYIDVEYYEGKQNG